MVELEHLEREFFVENLMVRIHFIIEMIRWTSLTPRESEFPVPGSLTSTFLGTLGKEGLDRKFRAAFPKWKGRVNDPLCDRKTISKSQIAWNFRTRGVLTDGFHLSRLQKILVVFPP